MIRWQQAIFLLPPLAKEEKMNNLITTRTTATAWSPDLNTFQDTDPVDIALLNIIGTKLGHIEGDSPVIRVAYVKDTDAQIVPEGAPIPEGQPELAEALIRTCKIAKLFRVSAEQWHQTQTPDRLSDSARETLVRTADKVFLNQADPKQDLTQPPAGILNQGIPDVGTVENNLDTLIDAVANIQAEGGKPTHIVLAPDAWAAIRKLKTAEGAATSLLGVGAADAVPTLLGIPVIVNNAMPKGKGLIVDKRSILVAVGDIEGAVSEHAYFNADTLGLRAIWRFGALVAKPKHQGVFTVGTAANHTRRG